MEIAFAIFRDRAGVIRTPCTAFPPRQALQLAANSLLSKSHCLADKALLVGSTYMALASGGAAVPRWIVISSMVSPLPS